MRKVLAAFLLFCVGIMVSASATPLRICLLDYLVETASEASACCMDCTREPEKSEPCCHDLEQLPDAPVPQDPVELPPAVVADLPPVLFLTPVPAQVCLEKFTVSEPIHGPTSPAAHRAVLGIWRL
jgi:hypothetical protein